jgi:hypothetical protein
MALKRTMLASTLLVASLASAQNPIKVTSANGVFTFTNVSKKTIILVAGHTSFSTPTLDENGNETPIQLPGTLVHEYMFKKKGFPVGDSFDIDTKDDGKVYPYTANITFVQFEDGSTWGDRNDSAAQIALQMRNESLSFLSILASATDEQSFLTILSQQTSDAARRFQQTRHGVGTTAAFANAKDRWAAAVSRRSMWSF